MNRFYDVMLFVLILLLNGCNGASSEKTTVTNPNNHAPVLSNQSLNAVINSPLTITMGPLTDTDGDALTYSVSGTTHTSAGSQANQIVFLTASATNETFTVRASDAQGASATATISITVSSSNVAPTISNQNLNTSINTNLEITLGALTDGDGDTVIYGHSGTTNVSAGSAANKIIYRTGLAGSETFTVTATDNKSPVVSAQITVVATRPNTAPAISNQSVEVVAGENRIITLGPLTDIDNDTIVYTVSPLTHITNGAQANQKIYNNPSSGSETLTVTATDNINPSVNATITVSVTSSEPSNYVTHRNVILPTLGTTPPAKGESRIDPTTGIRIERATDVTQLSGTQNSLIVYSRYSPESSDGKYFLVFGDNSFSSWVVERATGAVVATLAYDNTGRVDHRIGELHEIRWDYSGNHPKRVYFRLGMVFYMIDDVTNQANTRSVIRDFSSVVPAADTLYNDVEGDSSNDSDHWAFMAAHYNGSTYIVDAFLHYQISTNTVHKLVPADLKGSNLDAFSNASTFPARPNMVEMSPLGNGVIIHYGRSYPGHNEELTNTWFDGPYLWPLNFDWKTTAPIKVSIDETHSGWAFANDGREMFISQNNREDMVDAIYDSGANSGYANRVQMIGHTDFGDYIGFHFGKMPANRVGWAFINTYHGPDTAIWGANQLMMIQLKPKAQNPKIWRIGHNYNKFSGDYREEAPAAINLQGNRIYVSNDWGGQLNHMEVFIFHLPSDWTSAPALQ